MHNEIQLKLEKILNDNGIGSGSYYGKIMNAMEEAFFLGVHYFPILKDLEQKEVEKNCN